jgi:hypothetical protein
LIVARSYGLLRASVIVPYGLAGSTVTTYTSPRAVITIGLLPQS